MNKIYIINGTNPMDMVIQLLDSMRPVETLHRDARIGIKPNLVCAAPADQGATTHPEIVEGIILYLKKNGFSNIKIIESSWVGDSTKRAYKVCGYEDISKKYDVPLIDLKDDEYIVKKYKDIELKVCKTVFDIDYLINVPLIKGHCQTKITCALKNLKGLIPDSEKRRFHTIGLHKPIAYLNAIIKQDLIIADGICPDPYFEEGGRPEKIGRIAASFDPVLMDSYAAKVLGYTDEDIRYLKLAEKEGIGSVMSKSTEIIDVGMEPSKNTNIVQEDKKYLGVIEDADACSACYSNLASALEELDKMGLAETLVDQVCIGQAYKGYKGVLGVGNCTSCFERYLPGCPPKVDQIIRFLAKDSSPC